jgi:hypothetical protein
MLKALAILLILAGAAMAGGPETADPALDAPEYRDSRSIPYTGAPSYPEALQLWRTPEDVNAWIGARFEYSLPRAMLLSESQRTATGRLAVYPPQDFFCRPTGVCVDLARFAVETLKAIDPGTMPTYLMIEFAPVTIAGNTLRFHWLAAFKRDGRYYFFADSKRPGHMAGPYATVREFIEEYAGFRGREIVSYREADSYQRRQREPLQRQKKEEKH